LAHTSAGKYIPEIVRNFVLKLNPKPQASSSIDRNEVIENDSEDSDDKFEEQQKIRQRELIQKQKESIDI
jgi:hypothetical protein